MKVGTDGVLLGAWTSLDNAPNTILDIGAGTGLLALMLAQRSSAEQIDAVEMEDDAFEQCVANFEASPWSDRLFCYHSSFQEFYSEIDDTYDLIISNPPFYTEDFSSGAVSRDTARQNQSLPFPVFFEGVSHLLSSSGQLAIIVPHSSEQYILDLAENHDLFPRRITHVKGNPKSPIKRSLLQFSRTRTTPKSDVLTIETDRHNYTPEYIGLTRDFYLKM